MPAQSLPPGPALPAWVQTLRIIADPIGLLETSAERFGDTFTLRVLGPGGPPVVFFSDPDHIQQIFTGLADRLELGKVTHIFRPLVGDQSLIMQQGDRHRRQRQLLMPALHGERLNDYARTIEAIAATEVATWQPGQRLPLRSRMAELTLQMILRVVFGLEPGPRYDALRPRLATLLELVTDPLASVQFFLPLLQQDLGPWSPWGRFRRLMAEIDALIYEEIAERRQLGGDCADVLGLLIAARDDQGQPLVDEELRDQLITLLLLGHETTASSLTWAVYWLLRTPEALARLEAELATCAEPTEQVKLPYLDACCREALRARPVALISQPRRVRQPLELGGWQFQPGTVLVPCVLTAHGRRTTWGDDARQFRPERFLEQRFGPTEYLPFGGGARSCIGAALSLYEMKLVLATVLRHWQLTDTDARPLAIARRGITFVPPDSFQPTVATRRSAAPAQAGTSLSSSSSS